MRLRCARLAPIALVLPLLSFAGPSPDSAAVRTREVTVMVGTEPYYPKTLAATGAQGQVLVEASLGADGEVADARVVESARSPELDAAAVAYVRELKFRRPAPAAASAPASASASATASVSASTVAAASAPAASSAPAQPPLPAVRVPVVFRKDSLAWLKEKTCADLNADVAWRDARFPEKKGERLDVVHMTVGADMVMLSGRRGGLAAALKGVNAAADRAVAECQAHPDALWLDTYRRARDAALAG